MLDEQVRLSFRRVTEGWVEIDHIGGFFMIKTSKYVILMNRDDFLLGLNKGEELKMKRYIHSDCAKCIDSP